MCLRPQRKKSNSIYFNRHSYQSFYLEYPCGKCAECLELKKTQWYVRCYYQAKECFDADGGNGFIVFDTLTYDDEHLPHISDFMPVPEHLDFSCFDYRDVTAFLKRLRRALEYRGFDAKDNLKYFISSEYGHGDMYVDERGRMRRGTYRPHYHILFFCRSRKIDPVEFSKLVSETWQNGRNDGVVDKGRGYFINHNLFSPRQGKSSDESLRRVCNYVAKYVTKDPDYQDMIDERVNSIVEYYVDMLNDEYSDFSLSDTVRVVRDYLAPINNVIGKVQMFHKQSVGFGLYGIQDWYNVDEIWREGTISVPDREKIVLHMSCPKYYRIKLFYDTVRVDDGSYRYELNDDGREFRKLEVHRIIDRGVKKMNDWYLNLNINEKSKVDDMLINKITGEVRDFKDVVTYRNIYRGRIVDFDDNELPDVDDMIDRWNLFTYRDDNRYFPNFSVGRDVNVPYKSKSSLDSYYEEVLPWDKSDRSGVEVLMNEHFRYCNVGSFVINSSFNVDWDGFDEFIDYYDNSVINVKSRDDKQKVYDIKEKTKKLFKEISCFS